MSNSIKIDNLPKIVKKYLTNYVEDIEDGVKEATEKLSKEAVKELKKESPRRTPLDAEDMKVKDEKQVKNYEEKILTVKYGAERNIRSQREDI